MKQEKRHKANCPTRCDVGHSKVSGVQPPLQCDAGHTWNEGTSRVPSALTARKFKVKPLLAVPRLIGGVKTDGGGFDVERIVPHDEPLVLRPGQHEEAAALRPHLAMGLARAPLRRDV